MLKTRSEGGKYGILCIFSLFCEYTNLAYVRIHVIYRVSQAECVIRIHEAAPQEDVNTYSIRRGGAASEAQQKLAFTRYCHYLWCMV